MACVLAAALISSLGSAAFSVDANASTVKKEYNIGDKLSGTISISFANESSDSLLSANLGSKKITLADWLKQAGKKAGIDYNCTFAGCASDYQARQEVSSMSITGQQPKMVGFKISGANISAKTVSFIASTSLPNSCSKQFSIDVLDRDSHILENYRYTDQLCGNPLRGCFDHTLTEDKYQYANLTRASYCERLSLNPAPAYSFTANITKPSTAKYEEVSFDLYNGDFTTLYGSCTLAQGESRCTINYTITREGTYAACVSSNETNSAYQVRTEQSDLICGTANLGQTMTRDFDISAHALEYASGQTLFDNDKYAMLNNEENITDAINNYLKEEYNSDCIGQDCFIPLQLIGDAQTLTFTNPLLVYESDGVLITQNKLYEIARTPSSINSGRMLVSLDAAQLNVSSRNTLLQINLGNTSVIKSAVTVSSIPISIEPTFALIGVSTEFTIHSNLSITSATWKFSDDGSTQTGVKARHTFAKAGTYNIDVTAVTSNGSFTKTQQILVGEPRTSAEELVASTQANLGAISTSIKTVPQWMLPGVESKINIIQWNNSLMAIKEKLNYASNDSEYLQIISEVQALGVPESFGVTRSGSFPLIATYSNINVDYLNTLYGEDQTNPDQARAAILEWTRDNYNGQIEVITYGVGAADGNSPLVTKVKITLDPVVASDNQRYLIIDYPLESLHFLTGYSEKELQSGTYIPIQSSSVIEFYVEGETTIENLGVYVVPALSELRREGYSYEVLPSNEGKVKSFIYIALIILIVVLAVVAVAMQYWYRNNYEKHLFPKEESLFNVMTFIYNSKKNNLKEGDIRKNLLSSGWTREQISYALGRYEGKIFGIFGLPIYSARQEQKMKTAIENRQRQNASRKVY